MRGAKVWTEEEDARLMLRFPNERNAHLAELFGCTVHQLKYRAQKHGLRKSLDYLRGVVITAPDEGWPEWLSPSLPRLDGTRRQHVCRGRK